ncbi:hypothetical protein LTR17_007757 [Elasticomyces elasticus]|nr:hypothetical protein LTR17_007757 [Elasticomyces elasticus]
MARVFHHPRLQDLIEDVEEYRRGGYHPVHLGDIYEGRYKIVHKLGNGGFSTTWLARDVAGNHYCALKILKTEETALCTELHALQRLADIQTDHPGKSHIRSLVANFIIEGPNGQHTCLVTDVAGPSLSSVYNVPGCGFAAGARRLRGDLARPVVKQVVQAVDFLHSQNVCHGDLTLPNVLLKLKPMDDWTEEEVYERFGTPNKETLVAATNAEAGDFAPRYVVEPAGMPASEYLTHDVLLVDFGQTFQFDSPPKAEDIGVPFMYCAPETLFESKYDVASEIWSLACVLFEIRAGNPLFTSLMGGKDEIIQQMVQMGGKLPRHWWEAWEQRHVCFDEDGKPLKEWPNGIAMAQEYPIAKMVEDIGSEDEEKALSGPCAPLLEPFDTRVPGDEAEMMSELLTGMLKWAPKERSTVAAVLCHPWVPAERTSTVLGDATQPIQLEMASSQDVNHRAESPAEPSLPVASSGLSRQDHTRGDLERGVLEKLS